MMERLRSIGAYKIGVAAIAALVLLAVGVYALSVAGIGKRDYTAMLSHSAGLNPKEDVQVAGVSVGTVKSVTLDGNQVKVRFSMDDNIHLGDQTTAEVKVATVLGTHLLEINPKGSGDLPRGLIDVSHTTVPYNLQDVAEAAVPALNKYDGAKINQSLQVLADTFRGTPKEIQPALDGVIRLSDVINKRTAQVSALFTAARDVTDRLTKNTPDIVELMKQANLVLQELTSRRQTIDAMLASLTQLGNDIAGTLQDTKSELDPMYRDLNTAEQTLIEHRDDLQNAIQLLATTSRYVANATGSGPFINLSLPVTAPDNTTCTLNGGCAK
jgi:phospholipid/cholesterol/gamma-HCH transport system substrate-binding protein